MPIHMSLEGDHLSAVLHAITNQLADDYIQITKHLQDHSRLMSEVLDEPSGTPLDAGRLIAHLRAQRGEVELVHKLLSNEKDKGARLLTEAKAETERVQRLYTDAFNKAEKYRNLICGAVNKLGKPRFKRSKIADHLAESLLQE